MCSRYANATRFQTQQISSFHISAHYLNNAIIIHIIIDVKAITFQILYWQHLRTWPMFITVLKAMMLSMTMTLKWCLKIQKGRHKALQNAQTLSSNCSKSGTQTDTDYYTQKMRVKVCDLLCDLTDHRVNKFYM